MDYGDVIGDWREEVWYVEENRYLAIHTTSIPTTHRLVTLMHDTDYRTSVAAETSGYMQSTQPSFYLGPDVSNTSTGDASTAPGSTPERLRGRFPTFSSDSIYHAQRRPQHDDAGRDGRSRATLQQTTLPYTHSISIPAPQYVR